jgi:hypothetical protein
METERFLETLASIKQSTRRLNPKEHQQNHHCREKHKISKNWFRFERRLTLINETAFSQFGRRAVEVFPEYVIRTLSISDVDTRKIKQDELIEVVNSAVVN